MKANKLMRAREKERDYGSKEEEANIQSKNQYNYTAHAARLICVMSSCHGTVDSNTLSSKEANDNVSGSVDVLPK